MDTTIWLIVAIVTALLIGIGVGWLLWGRKTHVQIAKPTLHDPVATPTFSRVAMPKPQPTLAELQQQLADFNPPVSDTMVQNPDNLMQLKGVGPRLAKTLYDMGIGHFSTIAAWNHDDIRRIDAVLGPFAGRIERDEWVEQARYLAANDFEGFAKRFGKLGTDVS